MSCPAGAARGARWQADQVWTWSGGEQPMSLVALQVPYTYVTNGRRPQFVTTTSRRMPATSGPASYSGKGIRQSRWELFSAKAGGSS